jgi:hypothetical protein
MKKLAGYKFSLMTMKETTCQRKETETIYLENDNVTDNTLENLFINVRSPDSDLDTNQEDEDTLK